MKKKFYSCLVACLFLQMGAWAAEVPETLSITGTAVAEATEAQKALPMKLIDSTYEVYTSLQGGTFTFEGDASIATQSVTADAPTPYRVRVDYSGETPVVTAQKIEQVYMWAPWNQYTIGTLSYQGNATFKCDSLLGETGRGVWGDPRYRVRIRFEGDVVETYAHSGSKELRRASDSQWGGDAAGRTEQNFTLPSKYQETGVPFNIMAQFRSDTVYAHTITDYTVETVPAPESLTIQGSALAEYAADEAVSMKRFDTYLELYTSLQAGDYTFSDNTPGGTLTEDETGIYRIRVTYTVDGAVVSLDKIDRVYMWAINKNKTIAELDYAGNSVFRATNITSDPADWEASWVERRYRIRVDFASGKRDTYGPRSGNNFVLLENFGQWDYPYDLADKYKNGTTPFNLTVNFSVTGDYSFTIEDYVAPFPESLAMQGTALVEYGDAEAATMRKFEQYYELYTSLQAGDYAFSDETEGGSVETAGVYRVRVDYTDSPTKVVLDLVNRVYMWAPQAQGIVAELPYEGHGVFKQEGLRWNTADWDGDNRYRIRMDLGEGNDIFTETYGPKDGENFVLVGNAQWEPSNYNYTPEGFVDNGIAFDATLSLTAEGYTHTLVKSEDQSTLVPSVEAMARIYPTFVQDQIMVEAQGDCVVSIASVTGQMLQRMVCPLGTTTLDATGLPQGMLIVCVEQDGKIISTQRVIKL